ncbi:MAG: rod-binding protein [Enterobacteriaceae bacterium]
MVNAINNSAINHSSMSALSAAPEGRIKPQNLEQAAVQFEALFLRTMLKQMRKTADAISDEDSPFNSRQQRVMRDLYDDELAQTLASQRSSGIADLLVQQLGPKVAKK